MINLSSNQTIKIGVHVGECYPYYSIDTNPEDYQHQYEITLDECDALLKAYEDFRVYQIRLREIISSPTKVKEEVK